MTGNGVHCFIIDSGVSNYHEEFAGRVVSEFDAFTGASTQEDDFGHGTKGAITCFPRGPNPKSYLRFRALKR